MADILISMNKATEKLWKYADEWEKTPEHFDGVNPFCVAIHAVRQMTNAPELLKEQPDIVETKVVRLFMLCPECGEPILNGWKHCAHCGAKLEEGEA